MAVLARPKKSPKPPKLREWGNSLGNRIGLGVVLVLFALLAWGLVSGAIKSDGRRSFAPAGATPAQAAPGQPWEHDVRNNRHWDPRPGHQHWHSGPPPSEEERAKFGTFDATAAPAAPVDDAAPPPLEE